nr:hypothetical protein [Nocardia cyriacigeorgica]
MCQTVDTGIECDRHFVLGDRMRDDLQPGVMSVGGQCLRGLRREHRQSRAVHSAVIDDDLQIVGALGQPGLHEIRRLLGAGDGVERRESERGDIRRGEQLTRVAARRRRQGGRAAEVGDIVARCGRRPLGGEDLGEAEHVEFGRDAEGERGGQITVEDVGVGIDQARQQGSPGPIDLDIGRNVVGGDNPAVLDEHGGAVDALFAVEDSDIADAGAHGELLVGMTKGFRRQGASDVGRT